MTQKMDFLLEMECQTIYLDETIKALNIVMEDLHANLAVQERYFPLPGAPCSLGCTAANVMLRELKRIHDALDTAVSAAFQQTKENTTQVGGE